MATTPAKAPETTTEADKAPVSSTKQEAYVKYIGPATSRVLSEEDWETVGAKGQKAVEWNFANQFKVPVGKFSENALNYLKDGDDRFIVVGA